MSERLNARRHVLLLSLTLMETAWVATLAPVLIPALSAWPMTGVILILWSMVILHALLARRVLFSSLTTREVYILLALPALVTYLALARAFLYPDLPVLSARWLGPALGRLLRLLEPGPEVGALILTLVLWWRGLDAAQVPADLASLALRFRLEIILLVLGLVSVVSLAKVMPVANVWAFFLGSLVSLALMRIEAMGELEGPAARSFDRTWLAVVVATAMVMVGLSALVAHFVTPENARTLIRWLRPVWVLLQEALILLIAAISWLLLPVAMLIARVLFSLIARLQPRFPGLPEFPRVERPPAGLSEPSPWLTRAIPRLHNLLSIFVIVAVVILILVGIRREVQHRLRLREEQAQVGSTGEVVKAMAESARDLWQRLREWAQLATRYGFTPQFLAAISVYAIYTNLMRLAAAQGHPRQRSETPYEFLARLEALYPQAKEDMRAITEAFVAARYGEVPVEEAALDALREAWERTRQVMVRPPLPESLA